MEVGTEAAMAADTAAVMLLPTSADMAAVMPVMLATPAVAFISHAVAGTEGEATAVRMVRLDTVVTDTVAMVMEAMVMETMVVGADGAERTGLDGTDMALEDTPTTMMITLTTTGPMITTTVFLTSTSNL
jgi:hypothetical protein